MTFKDDSQQNSQAKIHSIQNPYNQDPYSYMVIHLIFFLYSFFNVIFLVLIIDPQVQVHLILNLQKMVVTQSMVVIQVKYLKFLMDKMLYCLLALVHFSLTFEVHLFMVNYLPTLCQHNYELLKVLLTQLFLISYFWFFYFV